MHYAEQLSRSKLLIYIWCLTPFSTSSKLYRGGKCTYPWFPGVVFTSTPHVIFSKPLAAFPRIDRLNNGQLRERNESFCNVLRRNISEAWDRTSDLVFSSPVRNRLSSAGTAQCYNLPFKAVLNLKHI